MTAWLNQFYIGTDTDTLYGDFTTLQALMFNYNKPVDPSWEFFPHSGVFDTGDGGRVGVGFPRAVWSWQHRKDTHVELLRNFCPGASALVYIRTPTNDTVSGERVWRTFQCQMLWMPESEDKQAGFTLGFQLEFRRLIVQAELV